MTSFTVIYEAFLSKILEDEWETWTESEWEADMHSLLMGALPWFKFPRKSLEYSEEGFIEDLNNEEIQIIATYMKCEWLDRTLLSWENVRPLYDERDFSQANLIDKFNQRLVQEKANAAKFEANYYRTIKGKPFSYSDLGRQDF